MFRFIGIGLLAISLMTGHSLSAKENLEQSVCGAIKEPFMFWLWRNAAGAPAREAANRYTNVDAIEHKTTDGRLLRGFRMHSARDGQLQGTVLVAQGNAMLADQLLPTLTIFADAGLDVVIFDYRGYGRSEGKPRLKAIISDYQEIFESLMSPAQGKRFLYGISFGGIVLLNLANSGVAIDGAVIDSTPSLVSNEGCPKRYDPLENFPADGSAFLMIGGELDNVVSLKDSSALFEHAKSRGARIEVRTDFAHPFMDSSLRTHQSRMELVRAHFTAAHE